MRKGDGPRNSTTIQSVRTVAFNTSYGGGRETPPNIGNASDAKEKYHARRARDIDTKVSAKIHCACNDLLFAIIRAGMVHPCCPSFIITLDSDGVDRQEEPLDGGYFYR